MGRKPIDPPPRMRRILEKALRAGEPVTVDGVTLYPPRCDLRRWRVKVHHERRTFDKTYGAGLGHAYKGFLEADAWLVELKSGLSGRPEFESAPLAGFIDDYVGRRGKSGKWSTKTQAQRRVDFRPLRAIAERDRLACRDLNAMHLRECLRAVGTAGRGNSLRGLLRTMLVFGRHAGYFTRDQAELVDAITWTPPVGYVRPLSRRDQAKLHVDIATGGAVMTHEQVRAWAKACQLRWVHGFAFIHTCALLGTRSGEIRPLTASPLVAQAGRGNLVDLEQHVVRIRWQATTEGEAKHLPKNNKIRDIAIPQAAPAGFRLDRWLAHRVPVALAEQARGDNPLALIFPNPSGGLFGEQNLRNRVWAPAAEDLGWAMEEYVTALGKKRRLFRFTLHALRDRFANTAIHEWKYPEDVLLQQGSWEDPETVRRFYAGVTDECQSIAMRIHGWAGAQ
jgi:integrase